MNAAHPSPAELAARLHAAIAGGLPGQAAQRSMAHGLAYGRHRGPVPDDARQAAVLLVVHPAAAGWSIPTVLRPDTMRSHAGQVSLPGGLIEADETEVQAALREYEEELGSPPAALEVLGQLTPVYVFVSGFRITPILAISARPLAFQPNPHEVAAVIELPLTELCNPANRGRHLIDRRGLRFQVPHFAIAGQHIWGATSLILAEFVALQSAGTKPGSGAAPETFAKNEPHAPPFGRRFASRFAPGLELPRPHAPTPPAVHLMHHNLTIETMRVGPDILGIVLDGSLNATTTDEFNRAIQDHLDQGRTKIIIDCRRVEYISSVGLGSLVALQARLRKKGGEVKLAGLNGLAADTIRLVGLDKLLGIYTDMEYARAAFYPDS